MNETNTTEIVEQKVTGMQKMVQSVKVTNEQELNDASDKVKAVKQLYKFIEQEKAKMTDPAKAIIARAKEMYDPYLDQCEEAEKAIKKVALDFQVKVQREKEARQAEIDSQAREAQAKIDADLKAKRITAEQAEAKTEKVAEKAIDKLEKVDDKKTTAKTGASTLSLKKVAVVKIVDEKLIPDEYWMIDRIKLDKVVKAGLVVPGTELTHEFTNASR